MSAHRLHIKHRKNNHRDVVALIILGVLVYIIHKFNPFGIDIAPILIAFGALFALLSVIVVIRGLYYNLRLSYLENKMSRWKSVHRCGLCFYDWSWSPGDPLPEIQDSPRLRELGQARLKREQEQRMWD